MSLIAQSLNQGSFKISLTDALADNLNCSNFQIICPSLTMSCFVKSSFQSSSKYISSSHSCNPGPELSATIPPPIAFHKPSHLSGSASFVISCIWPTRILGVIKKLSKGGWLTNISKSYKPISFDQMNLIVGAFPYHTPQAPQIHTIIQIVSKYNFGGLYC